MPIPIREIRWQVPISELNVSMPERISRDLGLWARGFFSAKARTSQNLENLVRTVGVPTVLGATSAKEWVLSLLKLASEVEHALMVQYLFAGWSLSTFNSPSGVDYGKMCTSVAIQEMGHLATVQNLLLLVGGPTAIHFDRDVQRQASNLNAIPFILESATKQCIAKFVAAEKPLKVPDDLTVQVNELLKIASLDANVALKRVGVIYELLHYFFSPPEGEHRIDFNKFLTLPEKRHLSATDLHPLEDVTPYLAVIAEGEWQVPGGMHLLAPKSLESALIAIETIAAQGEGLLSLQEESHFEVFMRIAVAFDAESIIPLNIARSPTLGSGGGEQGTEITDSYTRLWGTVFKLQYNLLLLSLQHGFQIKRSDDPVGSPGLREKLIDTALFNMRRVCDMLGKFIMTLPISTVDGLYAGPPFDLIANLLTQLDLENWKSAHVGLLDELEQNYLLIGTSPSFTDDHSNLLGNLRMADKKHRKLFL